MAQHRVPRLRSTERPGRGHVGSARASPGPPRVSGIATETSSRGEQRAEYARCKVDSSHPFGAGDGSPAQLTARRGQLCSPANGPRGSFDDGSSLSVYPPKITKKRLSGSGSIMHTESPPKSLGATHRTYYEHIRGPANCRVNFRRIVRSRLPRTPIRAIRGETKIQMKYEYGLRTTVRSFTAVMVTHGL